ncbi:uncharacterized protein LOC131670549 isoform X2 [Phymastichus coffea]|uniref:uncharacterized protein LOC131670549 isoform X2 n=1 Tax=Phymastichus coffea TaxID=108790 RepID=UPI00273B2314|nr:uncharacterized protein LOC131670549 isoform X2 [Phymastichus coffea]
MALLYRFAQLPDRSGTRVFSFVVTRSVVRDPERDVTSKELVCGFQRWAVAFSRGDKMLGVYLVWRGAAPGLKVYVDFTFTLLNREHFSVNEGFSGKRVKFTYEAPAQGNRNYISISDLYTRNFADPNGEFQLELSMANVRTIFSCEVGIPDESSNADDVDLRPKGGSTMFPSGGPKVDKIETEYFAFGGFDWNLVVYPHGNKEDRGSIEGGMSFYLVRMTGFDHRCRVRYIVSLGDGTKRFDSGALEDINDAEGRGYGWHPKIRWAEVAHKNVLKVSIEMLEARTISEVLVQALGPGSLPATPCYDKEKQAWAIRADMHSTTVRLGLVYKDIHNVPRNHLRYVSWTAYLIRAGESATEIVSLPGAPFSRYYAQENADEGIIMETSIGVNDVKGDDCPFVTEKGQIRVRIEWLESHLLFQATYHKYDDVCRVHNQQMRREIAALQAENYSLERQLFSYQKSLAYAQAQQQQSGDEAEAPSHPGSHHQSNQHQSAHLERSASTDTEYA